jgi:DNA-binding transcriptional ArsR family regulator
VNDPDRAAAPGQADQAPARAIADAETLRALADPLRLRILFTLMQRDDDALPVMSVKEIAASLGEPQTKLYRHVKHLEAAGLIKAVASRVVSGIVEQRYQACQSDLRLGTTPDDEPKPSPEAEAATAAVLEWYRSRFFAARRSGLAASGRAEPMLGMNTAKVTPAMATEIQQRLGQVLGDLTTAEADAKANGAETVTVNVLVGYFS